MLIISFFTMTGIGVAMLLVYLLIIIFWKHFKKYVNPIGMRIGAEIWAAFYMIILSLMLLN